MTKRSVLTIRVPEELKRRLERLAHSQGVSLNQLALYAFSKEASSLETQLFFSQRLGQKKRSNILAGFDLTLSKAKAREPFAPEDEL
ncbi:MAG: toxin-antitoxin system HicB family antitoxin [Deinococcales bacterium]